MKIFPVIFLILFLFPQNSFSGTPITIYYVDRVPYHYMDDNGKVVGIVATPAIKAFQKAGVPYVLKELPAKRILVYLKENRPNICGIGWYKNPEREKFAKYSLPVSQNKSRIAVTRKSNTLIPSGKTLETVFKMPKITLLIKDGYSYGNYIDEKIRLFKPNIYKTTQENDQMLEMIFRGSNNYFFLSEEEADALIEQSKYQKEDFKYIRFSDIPVGLKRYILFSKQVDDQIINRINKAISQDVHLQAPIKQRKSIEQ
jgi:uncharacterized protein (TIGR02285 family)